VFAAKAVIGDLPKGAIEVAVEKKLLKPSSGLARNFVKGLAGRGSGRAIGAGLGVLTAPIFLRGMQLASSKNKAERRKGVAMLGGVGSVFALQKGVIEGAQAARAEGASLISGLGRGLRLGGFRALYKTPAALALALGVAAGRRKSKDEGGNSYSKFILPTIAGAGVGALSRASEDVIERAATKGLGGNILRAVRKSIPAGVGGAAGGAFGGLVLSGITDMALKALEKSKSKEKTGSVPWLAKYLAVALSEKAIMKASLGYGAPGRLMGKFERGRRMQAATHDAYARQMALGLREGLIGKSTASPSSNTFWGAVAPEMVLSPRHMGRSAGELLRGVPAAKREEVLRKLVEKIERTPALLRSKSGDPVPYTSHARKAMEMATGERPFYKNMTPAKERWLKFFEGNRGVIEGKGLPAAGPKEVDEMSPTWAGRWRAAKTYGPAGIIGFGGGPLGKEIANLGLPGLSQLDTAMDLAAPQFQAGITKPFLMRFPPTKKFVEGLMRKSLGRGIQKAVLPNMKRSKVERVKELAIDHILSPVVRDPGRLAEGMLSGAVTAKKKQFGKMVDKAAVRLGSQKGKEREAEKLRDLMLLGAAGSGVAAGA